MSPKITRRLIDHYTRQHNRGLTNAEISAQHHISLSTTKTHAGNLLTKLAARDRVQLTITAYEAGLMRA